MSQRGSLKWNKKIYIKLNKSGNTAHYIVWYTTKAELRVKFIVLNAYIKNKERSQISNLNSHLNNLEKEEQSKPKTSLRKDIVKRRNQWNRKEKNQGTTELVLWKDQ